MVPPPFTEATTTRDPLYNGDSFISMNSRLDPFLNFSARYFLNDSTISNICRSTMDIGSRGNHGLVTSGSSLSTSIKLKKVSLAKCVLSACILLVTKYKFRRLQYLFKQVWLAKPLLLACILFEFVQMCYILRV